MVWALFMKRERVDFLSLVKKLGLMSCNPGNSLRAFCGAKVVHL